MGRWARHAGCVHRRLAGVATAALGPGTDIRKFVRQNRLMPLTEDEESRFPTPAGKPIALRGSRWLAPEPLEAHAFSPFGDVMEPGRHGRHRSINEGYAERYDDLARLDTGRQGGRPVLSVFRARPRALPFQVRLVERHVLGSQAFMPLLRQRFLVIVAPAGPAPSAAQLRCFMATSGQGVNYAAGTWHHPLIALDAGGDFLVIDRGGPLAQDDCEEHSLLEEGVWVRE